MVARISSFTLVAACVLALASGFSIPSRNNRQILTSTVSPVPAASTTQLWNTRGEKNRLTKKGVSTITKPNITPVDDPAMSKEEKEDVWRVVLHNDEVHTFNYVIRGLCKVVGTLDRKASFEICVECHGVGKATVTKTWKKQAEQFCLGLQRQGLTASICPDKDFESGHSGGGL